MHILCVYIRILNLLESVNITFCYVLTKYASLYSPIIWESKKIMLDEQAKLFNCP